MPIYFKQSCGTEVQFSHSRLITVCREIYRGYMCSAESCVTALSTLSVGSILPNRATTELQASEQADKQWQPSCSYQRTSCIHSIQSSAPVNFNHLSMRVPIRAIYARPGLRTLDSSDGSTDHPLKSYLARTSVHGQQNNSIKLHLTQRVRSIMSMNPIIGVARIFAAGCTHRHSHILMLAY